MRTSGRFYSGRGCVRAVRAGAGIVYDSDPVREWEETVHKKALECGASAPLLSRRA
ncbi:MAG TPA: chorismate-binding protein [Thermoanaerobaculia bacterium]|nr:chorismate-binding protein [Thermoanaerobaculia bacterium]